MYPCSDLELRNTISGIKGKETVDHLGVSTTLIKESFEPILQHLVHIINMSLEQGIFPDSLKYARLLRQFIKMEI